MESDYPRGTCENVVYHSHVTIQTILTSYLRPVKDENQSILLNQALLAARYSKVCRLDYVQLEDDKSV